MSRASVIQFPEQVGAWLDVIQNAEMVGFDTEASGPAILDEITTSKVKGKRTHKYAKMIDMTRSHTNGFSFYVDGVGGAYVPVGHYKGNLPKYEARRLLRALFDRTLAVWNAQHEYMAIEAMRLDVAPQGDLLDAMVLCFNAGMVPVVYKNGKETLVPRLKETAKRHLGVTMTSFDSATKGLPVFAMEPQAIAAYAIADAQMTLKLGQMAIDKMDPATRKWAVEVDNRMPRVLLAMRRRGITVDVEGMRSLASSVERDVADARKRFEWITNKPWDAATDLFGTLWKGAKPSKTGKGVQSADTAAMARVLSTAGISEDGLEAARLRAFGLEAAPLANVFGDGFLLAATESPTGDRVHPSYKQAHTATGRLAASDPAVQNIPAHSELGQKLRKMLSSPGSARMAACDYKQIEVRVLAHFSGGALAQMLKDGVDIHQATADRVGVSRTIGKTVVLAEMYGSTMRGLAMTKNLDETSLRLAQRARKEMFPEVDRLRERAIKAAFDRGYIRTLSGRRRDFSELSSLGYDAVFGEYAGVKRGLCSKDEVVRSASIKRRVFNTLCQGSAADIIKIAMLAVHDAGITPDCQIHDDLRVAEEHGEAVKSIMQGAQKNSWWDMSIPLDVDMKVSETW
jgi:DNA polymerase-1